MCPYFSEMPKVLLNGKEITFEPGKTILEIAWENGIDIPVFCYHPNLPVIAACRMCLVTVEHRGRKGFLPACATQAQEGMKIETQSEEVKRIRNEQLQFLLLNHPLECPVCDAGGECDLQNLTFRHGPTTSPYEFPKSEKERRYAGPFLKLYPNRCIICYRCVSFYNNVQGGGDWGYEDRGTEIVVGPYRDTILKSEFSGNMIEICPLGAITGSDYRFKIRPWEYTVKNSISPHDSLGANLKVYLRIGTRYGRGNMVTGGYRGEDHEIFRCNIRVNPDINDPWIDDRSRFVHEFVNSDDRLYSPIVKKEGTQEETTLSEALLFIKTRLEEIISKYGANAIGGIAGGIGTNEAALLFQHLLRKTIGTPNIDSRPPTINMEGDPVLNVLGISGSSATQGDIDTADVVLGFNLQIKNAFPLLGLRLLRQKKYGLSFHLTPFADPDDRKYFRQTVSFHPCHEVDVSALIVNLISRELGYLDGTTDTTIEPEQCGLRKDDLNRLVREMVYGGQCVIIVDDSQNPRVLHNLTLLSVLIKAKFLLLRTQPNGQGMIDQGLHPELLPGQIESPFRGFDTYSMLKAAEEGEIKSLLLWNVDPIAEFPNMDLVKNALNNIDLLVVFDSFLTETAKIADVVVPVATHFEESGTYTTTDGILQPVEALLTPPGYAQDSANIFHALLKLFGEKIDDPVNFLKENNPLYSPIYPPTEERKVEKFPDYIPSVSNLSDVYTYPRVKYPFSPRVLKPYLGEGKKVEKGIFWLLRKNLYWTRYGIRSPIVSEFLPNHQIEMHPETAKKLGLSPDGGRFTHKEIEFHYKTNPYINRGVVLLLWPPLKTKTNMLYKFDPMVNLKNELMEEVKT